MSELMTATNNLWNDVWADDGLKERLTNEPAALLKEYGIDVGNAKVDLQMGETPGSQPKIDWSLYGTDDTLERAAEIEKEDYEAIWNSMVAHGRVLFIVPTSVNDELSDDELELVAGGKRKMVKKAPGSKVGLVTADAPNGAGCVNLWC